MNKLDTALVSSVLRKAGFTETDSPGEADIFLINTCSVRQHAEDRVLSHMGRLKHLKKSKPEMVVAVIGCMAQRLGAELLNHEAVDIVCGPAQIPQITGLLTEALQKKKKALAITKKIRQKAGENQTEALEEFESFHGAEDKQQISGQAFVRAMRGCNKFCSYCVVPYVRGLEVSRAPAAIIEQIKKLADVGVKQITLLGQTINSYKYTAGDKVYQLPDLLEMANGVEAIKWLRFITNYPADFDESILYAMADLPKVCPHLHIPAQSGSDKILRAMNRNYTAGQYLSLVDKARQIVPGIAVAGDFIVGFPGETDEDFQATVSLVQKARYKNCFVFKYSPRPGTGAIKKLADTTPAEVKKQRNIRLLEVQNEISAEYNKRFSGQTVEVLVEGLSKKPHLNAKKGGNGPQLVGRTATDYIAVFNGPESLAGEFANIKITRTSPLTLFGNLVTQSLCAD